MMRRPHEDGGPGGVRIEVRGTGAQGYQTEVRGTMVFPSVATGAVAAVAALTIHRAAEQAGGVPRGAMGLAELTKSPSDFLLELHRRGVVAARFVGSG